MPTIPRPPGSPPAQGRKRPAIFVDRDGVVIELIDYLSRPEQVALVPGVAAAIAEVNRAGIPVVMVTNQSAIARGLLTEAGLAEVHERLRALLAREDAHLDAVYYCPHHPDIGEPPYRRACACRKPEPGMLLQAAADLGLDLARSAFIGDHATDVEAGRRAGIGRMMLVRTGHGRAAEAALAAAPHQPSSIHDDVVSAIRAARAALAGADRPAARD